VHTEIFVVEREKIQQLRIPRLPRCSKNVPMILAVRSHPGSRCFAPKASNRMFAAMVAFPRLSSGISEPVDFNSSTMVDKRDDKCSDGSKCDTGVLRNSSKDSEGVVVIHPG